MSYDPVAQKKPAAVEPEPAGDYVGKILGTQPAVKRASRNVAFRGYRVFVCAEIDENGKSTATSEFFKPTRQYDRGVVNPGRYTPHQSERECIRRLRQLCQQGMTPPLDINL